MQNPIVTLANMFSSKPAAPAPQVVMVQNPIPQGTPGNIPPNGTMVQTVPGNPTSPTVPGTEGAAPKSPLDGFSTLWDSDPNKKATKSEPLFNIDSKAIADSASKVDFLSSIPPEVMTKIKSGGEEGMLAMLSVMNTVGQQAYGKGAEAAALIAQEGIKKFEGTLPSKLSSAMKRENLRNSFAENPALNNPAAQPLVAMVTSQLQVKHPTATESQLRQMASEYFDGLANVITSENPAARAKSAGATKASKDFDFSNW